MISQLTEIFVFIWKQLEQAIGRARLVNNNCDVVIFTKFILHQSQLIAEKELNDLISTNKKHNRNLEIMKKSSMD